MGKGRIWTPGDIRAEGWDVRGQQFKKWVQR